jgi:hypothetical protein
MVSWRDKCIEEFELLPVPWQEEVKKGSEETWKNYYDFRIKWCSTLYDDDDGIPYDGSGDHDGSIGLIRDWGSKLNDLRDELLVLPLPEED